MGRLARELRCAAAPQGRRLRSVRHRPGRRSRVCIRRARVRRRPLRSAGGGELRVERARLLRQHAAARRVRLRGRRHARLVSGALGRDRMAAHASLLGCAPADRWRRAAARPRKREPRRVRCARTLRRRDATGKPPRRIRAGRLQVERIDRDQPGRAPRSIEGSVRDESAAGADLAHFARRLVEAAGRHRVSRTVDLRGQLRLPGLLSDQSGAAVRADSHARPGLRNRARCGGSLWADPLPLPRHPG